MVNQNLIRKMSGLESTFCHYGFDDNSGQHSRDRDVNHLRFENNNQSIKFRGPDQSYIVLIVSVVTFTFTFTYREQKLV